MQRNKVYITLLLLCLSLSAFSDYTKTTLITDARSEYKTWFINSVYCVGRQVLAGGELSVVWSGDLSFLYAEKQVITPVTYFVDVQKQRDCTPNELDKKKCYDILYQERECSQEEKDGGEEKCFDVEYKERECTEQEIKEFFCFDIVKEERIRNETSWIKFDSKKSSVDLSVLSAKLAPEVSAVLSTAKAADIPTSNGNIRFCFRTPKIPNTAHISYIALKGTTYDACQSTLVNITNQSVKFWTPTEANNTYLLRNNTPVNISISTDHLDTFKFNWNGSNYSVYDSSLVLALNFNNNSAIGENDTYFVDVSKYGNNGTCSGSNCPAFNSGGRFGGAMQFDGVNDYLTIPDGGSLVLGNNFTIMGYFNPSGGFNGFSDYYQGVMDKGSYRVFLDKSEGKLKFAYISNDSKTWTSLGSGINTGVTCLVVWNGSLYAGGSFTTAGGVSANRTARWDGSTWSALGSGVGGTVYSLVVWNGSLYAGGGFTAAGVVSANRTARWDGSSWTSLGSGVGSTVYSLVVWNGSLYASGGFITAGGVSANRIARWDGSTWSALGSGMSGGTVYSLVVWNGSLYAGGSFTTTGVVSANRTARWDGSTWTSLGSGMDSTVYSLGVWNGSLYAGGSFTTAGEVSANKIARWDGSTWSALGSGVGSTVYSLVVWNGSLYASGSFTTAGEVSANKTATWDGSSWSALGSGMDSSSIVYSLVVWNGSLYAGGDFTTAGGVSANKTAKWGSDTDGEISSSTNSWPNIWNQFAITYDGTNIYLYINKILESSKAYSGYLDQGRNSLLIGKSYGIRQGGYSNSGEEQFNGLIDEIRIYTHSLSAGEIQLHYQSEFQKYNSTEYRFYANVTNLSSGTYTYFGWANDSFGNNASTDNGSVRYFTNGVFFSMNISRINQIPSDIVENSSGRFVVSFSVNSSSDINTTRCALYRTVWDSIGNDYYWSFRIPDNNKSANISAYNSFGKVFRADNRNEGDWYETESESESNIWKWGITDYSNIRVNISGSGASVVFTYNGSIQDSVFPSTWYLDRTKIESEVKIGANIYLNHPYLVKRTQVIDRENFSSHVLAYVNFSGSTPTDNLNVFYCNDSYSLSGGVGFGVSPFCAFVGGWNTTNIQSYVMSARNSSYNEIIYTVNRSLVGPTIRASSNYYLIFDSNTPLSKPYSILTANSSSGDINVSFANAGMSYTSTNGGVSWSMFNRSADVFVSNINSGKQLQYKLVCYDVSGQKNVSTTYTDDIGAVIYPTTSTSSTTTTTTTSTTTTTLPLSMTTNSTLWIFTVLFPVLATIFTLAAFLGAKGILPSAISSTLWYASSMFCTRIRFVSDFTTSMDTKYIDAGNWEVGTVFLALAAIMGVYTVVLVLDFVYSSNKQNG